MNLHAIEQTQPRRQHHVDGAAPEICFSHRSARTEELVTSYLTEQWKALGSKYALEVKMVHGGPAWVSRCVEINQ